MVLELLKRRIVFEVKAPLFSTQNEKIFWVEIKNGDFQRRKKRLPKCFEKFQIFLKKI